MIILQLLKFKFIKFVLVMQRGGKMPMTNIGTHNIDTQLSRQNSSCKAALKPAVVQGCENLYTISNTRKLATLTLMCDFLYFHIFLVAQLSFSDSDCQEIAYINNSEVDNYSEMGTDTSDLESKCRKSCIYNCSI